MWGEIFFSRRVGHDAAAIAAYRATRRCSASRLSGVPRRVTNSGSLGRPARSASQACRTVPVAAVSGVIRRFRPLPRQLTWAARCPGARRPRSSR